MTRPRLLVLNGPNLSRLGRREPEVYGRVTLAEIDRITIARADAHGFDCDCRQYDGEGELVTALNRADEDGYMGIVINPAAYTHYSVALLDAVAACSLPVIEVHLSNIFAREEFRRRTVTGAGARAVIAGLGPLSYEVAVDALCRLADRAGAH